MRKFPRAQRTVPRLRAIFRKALREIALAIEKETATHRRRMSAAARTYLRQDTQAAAELGMHLQRISIEK